MTHSSKDKERYPKCLAPWTHSFIFADGRRGLCCQATPFPESEEESYNFATYWNSDLIRNVRKKMLHGELPEEYCQVCLDSSRTDQPPYKHYDLTEEEKEIILKNTNSESGEFGLNPSYLDYRLDNLCNLGCRTCSSVFSSSIANKSKQVPQIPLHQNKERLEDEYRQLAQDSRCNRLYFASGETLLQVEHWQFLESLISSGRSSSIALEYNTNLFHSTLFAEKSQNILKNFKSVNLSISIDHVGSYAEFIRTGVKWSKFEENLKKAIENSLYKINSLDITFTLPLLLEPEPLFRFLYEMKLSYTLQRVSPGGYATLLSPDILPKENQILLYSRALNILSKKYPHLKDFELFLEENKSRVEKNGHQYFSSSELIESYRSSVELDNAFKRKPLLSFYEQYTFTHSFFKKLDEQFQEKERERINHTNHEPLFWENFLLRYMSKVHLEEKTLLFPQSVEIKHLLPTLGDSDYFLLLSKPTFLSKCLSGFKNEKFEPYQYLMDQKRDLKFEEIPLSAFVFLFKKYSFFREIFLKYNKTLTFLFPFLVFHSLVRVKKTKP